MVNIPKKEYERLKKLDAKQSAYEEFTKKSLKDIEDGNIIQAN